MINPKAYEDKKYFYNNRRGETQDISIHALPWTCSFSGVCGI